jgi:hypothetical protein
LSNASIVAYLPSFCFIEARYTLDIIFQCIGYYDIEYKTHSDTNFVLSDHSSGVNLIIKNYFFSENEKEWYQVNKIPENIKMGQIYGQNVLAIYGRPHYDLQNHELHLDIVSSAFFMLSRWEEVANKALDEHGRFDQYQALAVKCKFITRPIVDEYALLLAKILNLPCRFSSTRIDLSFDIDYVYKWKSIKTLLGICISKKYTILDKIFLTKSFVKTKLYGRQVDPYFIFDYVLDQLQKYKLSAFFFFKTGISDEIYDKNDYSIHDPVISDTIKNLIDHRHTIGLHPSYSTMASPDIMQNELTNLQSVTSQQVKFVRQHYLRSKLPNTLLMQETLGFSEDSSIMYSRNFGFRCGIARPYHFFDIHNKKITRIKIKPLVAMTSVGIKLSLKEQMDLMHQLIKTINDVKGEAYLLFHNSDLDNQSKQVEFEKILSAISKLNGIHLA